MRMALKRGFCFGLISGIITTLGLIVGLHSSTHSRIAVIGGILVIAFADALSDALGMHISEESDNRHTTRQIWESTFATFFSKLVFALTFIVPVLLFTLFTAIAVSVVWGLLLVSFLSYYLARQEGVAPHKVILEHVAIAILVIIATHYIGDWVAGFSM